jgi:hypothetical protein
MALMNKMMDGIIVLLVFGALVSTVANYTIGVANTGNVTGITGAILPLTLALLTIGLMVAIYRSLVSKKG